jgi:hypothetical protein
MARHRFQKGSTPWNKGKSGLEAGWTEERRQRQSELQKQWLAANPQHRFWGEAGPHRWITGPDPEIRQLRQRWSRSRAQARYFCQEWTITWEDYLDLYKTAPGRWRGRTSDVLHLMRIDRHLGWHIHNVRLENRGESMSRPKARMRNGELMKRKIRNQQ